VVVNVVLVDKMEKDPFEVIQDGDYVEVDANSEIVTVNKKK